jgi:hypothetical protein
VTDGFYGGMRVLEFKIAPPRGRFEGLLEDGFGVAEARGDGAGMNIAESFAEYPLVFCAVDVKTAI